MARTSEFWVADPFGLSRHLDYPQEAILFRGRFIKDNDWLMPERFIHDEEIVRGVKSIARVNDTAIVGDTFAGDYFAVHLPEREVRTGLSRAEFDALLAKWRIQEPTLLSFDQAESAFDRRGKSFWVWGGSVVAAVGVLLLVSRVRRRKRQGRMASGT